MPSRTAHAHTVLASVVHVSASRELAPASKQAARGPPAVRMPPLPCSPSMAACADADPPPAFHPLHAVHAPDPHTHPMSMSHSCHLCDPSFFGLSFVRPLDQPRTVTLPVSLPPESAGGTPDSRGPLARLGPAAAAAPRFDRRHWPSTPAGYRSGTRPMLGPPPPAAARPTPALGQQAGPRPRAPRPRRPRAPGPAGAGVSRVTRNPARRGLALVQPRIVPESERFRLR